MRRLQIAANTVEIDGDVIRSVVRSPATIDTARPFLRLAEEVLRAEGRCFLLIINEGSFPIDSAARRYTFEWTRRHQLTGSASVGGGAAYRTVLTLLGRALSLVSARVAPTAFFASEAEARLWIDELRRIHLSRSRSSDAHPKL